MRTDRVAKEAGMMRQGNARPAGVRPGRRLLPAAMMAAAGLLALADQAEAAAGGEGGGGQSYRIQLVNNTCADLSITWDDGLACDTPASPGCRITLGVDRSTNLNLNLERRSDNLKLHATGRCAGGSAAPARVAGDSDPGQVAKALQAADGPVSIDGSCLLPLTKMFPYEGVNLQAQETVGVAPIVQPAPGGGFAYGSAVAGDPFGPVGPWGEPAATITTTVPEITSPIPVLLELGTCTPGEDGSRCGFSCTPQDAEGGLPDEYPGQLDNTD